MPRYLLAAEADKIQDFIFRSARLREVVGGSQLLTRFCREVPDLLNIPEDDVIINDGGSFRILFDELEQAKTFGADLAEVYRRATGGSLTVAEPVLFSSDFDKASEQAEQALRKAKRWRESWQGQAHLPYMAFCASCGIGLAVTHQAYHEEEDAQYLCASCLNKSAERRLEQDDKKMGEFLRKFYSVVTETANPDAFDWPGKEKRKGRNEIDSLADVADYDPRRYVAYLLADGNNMGQLFGQCRDPEQIKALSCGLSMAVRKALAVPTRKIIDMEENIPSSNHPDFIPILPLILGGDDIFVLIPAPWSLDFAVQFCQEYEQEMSKLLEDSLFDSINVPKPTIAATVVICKSNHPYKLAHEAGEKRLKEAKRISKQLVLDGGVPCSMINFEVVLGGRLVADSSDEAVRTTLRPYWVSEQGVSDGWGISVQELIEQRYKLRGVPHKRLAELKALYDQHPARLNSDESDAWGKKLEKLLRRIARNEDHKEAVTPALKSLGEGSAPYWHKVDRYPSDTWYGHGLPDLLETWNFSLDLEKSRQDYEEVD